MPSEVVEVESEKEKILQQMLQRDEDISGLKARVAKLQGKIDSHVCTIVSSSVTDDPTAKLSKLISELGMEEIDLKKSQGDLETTIKFIRAKDREIQISKENVEK